MAHFFFDRTGAPISELQCRALMASERYRRVLVTHLPDGRTLSTEWVGYDHRPLLCSKAAFPLVFESELFPDREVRRYATEKEARAGHAAWLSELQH